MSSDPPVFPIRKNTEKRWTPEFRKEWNRQYREKIKNGTHVPAQRPTTPDSKWNDPLFRKAYDKARIESLKEKKFEKQTSFDQSTTPQKHYTKTQKKAILDKMLELHKNGQDYSHPHLVLTLALKDEFKSKRKTRTQN